MTRSPDLPESAAREQQLKQWLDGHCEGTAWHWAPASQDASQRRYWRVQFADGTLIAVDAPPPGEDAGRFVRLAASLRQAGLTTPDVVAADTERGFLLLGDLGQQPYLDALSVENAERLYADALAALIRLQSASPTAALPLYDAAFLARELGLFKDWLLTALLRLPLGAEQEGLLSDAFATLIESALSQPRVCVHRDFHSRNLMVIDKDNPGVLDFQDAVMGPVTYDVVSLLRDCYIDWPNAEVERWAWSYFDQAVSAGILRAEQSAAFMSWFDLMGMQRHLKAAGIFARLCVRDGRDQYLRDLPRTLSYVIEVASRYPALHELGRFVATVVMPRLAGQRHPCG